MVGIPVGTLYGLHTLFLELGWDSDDALRCAGLASLFSIQLVAISFGVYAYYDNIDDAPASTPLSAQLQKSSVALSVAAPEPVPKEQQQAKPNNRKKKTKKSKDN